LWRRVPDSVSSEEIRLEGWLRDFPHEDRGKRLFSMPFDSQQEGTLRINTTFRAGRFSNLAMKAVLGWSESEDIIVFWSSGAPVVLVYDEELARCLSLVRNEKWRKEEQSPLIEELASIGLLVWLPERKHV
jgi:hypothetical protein